jgi:UDP-N-acetylglucosamine diphosphorylase/glucosamine-1-phosphate N-acetyltransferase
MICLIEPQNREGLYPFTLTRATADIRIGIFTIREKWERLTGKRAITKVDESAHTGAIRIPANLIPDLSNYQSILQAAALASDEAFNKFPCIRHPWQIFQFNDKAIRDDFEMIRKNQQSSLPQGSVFIHPENIIIEEGAKISHSILNAETGPIYIARDAEIMEGCMIRGPFAMGEKSVLKMGTKIYGATTLGPYCVAGGEIKNAVFFGFSNKAHDGYLGDSVIGEWCNLGAGTSNSNIKNNGSPARYDFGQGREPMEAGLKAGLLMADYSRSAINTSFNTASVVGVSCNIISAGMVPRYVPSFTWADKKYEFAKAIADIRNWKKMKGADISEAEIEILKNIYNTID